MFKLLNRIEDVFRYTCLDGFLIIAFRNEDQSGVIKKFALPKCEVVQNKKVKSYLTSFSVQSKKVLSTDIDNNGYILNESLDIIEEIPPPLKIGDNHVFSDLISVYRGKIKEREFGIYSIQNRRILWMDSGQKALESFGEVLLGQNNYEIYRSDFLTGEILWKIDLKSNYPSLLQTTGRIATIGVHHDNLIIGLEQAGKVLALSLKSGSIKWEIDTPVNGLYLDGNKKLIHQMMVNYASFDLETGKLKDNFKNSNYFQSNGIESQRSNYVLIEDYIVTTDWRNGNIGAFNIKTHKFDWIEKENGMSFPASSPMIYSEPYLIVLNNKGILYLFQKE